MNDNFVLGKIKYVLWSQLVCIDSEIIELDGVNMGMDGVMGSAMWDAWEWHYREEGPPSVTRLGYLCPCTFAPVSIIPCLGPLNFSLLSVTKKFISFLHFMVFNKIFKIYIYIYIHLKCKFEEFSKIIFYGIYKIT